jgi:hypothetical protein
MKLAVSGECTRATPLVCTGLLAVVQQSQLPLPNVWLLVVPGIPPIIVSPYGGGGIEGGMVPVGGTQVAVGSMQLQVSAE